MVAFRDIATSSKADSHGDPLHLPHMIIGISIIDSLTASAKDLLMYAGALLALAGTGSVSRSDVDILLCTIKMQKLAFDEFRKGAELHGVIGCLEPQTEVFKKIHNQTFQVAKKILAAI